jgi:UDP-N-acetylbacillosamine N-acetyltransferase
VSTPAGLLILGCGGHARSVADVALAAGVGTLLFVDPNARPGEQCLGFPVLREFNEVLPQDWACMPAIGDNHRRQQQLVDIGRAGWLLATLIAPTATIGVGSRIGAGSFIAHHAHIGPMASVGMAAIINTGGVVEHESVIGDYTHVSVNSTVAGRSSLGKFVFLGTGATVIDGVAVGDGITIGAGAVVIAAISEPGTYVGVPARRIGKRSANAD